MRAHDYARHGTTLWATFNYADGSVTGERHCRHGDQPLGTPRGLGIDDFALRKGHVYGPLLVDAQTRRPMEVLPEHSARAVKEWLIQHPGGGGRLP